MRIVCCPDCRKRVRDKPLIGTLHVCLSPEERSIVRQGRWAAEMQKRAIGRNADMDWLKSLNDYHDHHPLGLNKSPPPPQ